MPETASTDRVTAYLAEVQRDLTDGAAYPHRVMALHAPHLLAAARAVLDLADRWEHPPSPAVAHEVVQGCGQELRRAVTAALLGEGADGG